MLIYALLFGHCGAPGLWRPNNDGTVTLASQLRRAAQEEARLIVGYDEEPHEHPRLAAGHFAVARLAGPP
jgi:hypothetical protein